MLHFAIHHQHCSVIFGYLYYSNKHTGNITQNNASCELIKRKQEEQALSKRTFRLGELTALSLYFDNNKDFTTVIFKMGHGDQNWYLVKHEIDYTIMQTITDLA